MKSFLPQDTLSVEVMSLGYLLSMILSIMMTDIVFPFNNLLNKEFWLVIFGALSCISAMTIFINKLTPIRILLQWVLGLVFVYLALSRIAIAFSPTDIAALIIGISNFYASFINTNILIKDFNHV